MHAVRHFTASTITIVYAARHAALYSVNAHYVADSVVLMTYRFQQKRYVIGTTLRQKTATLCENYQICKNSTEKT